MYGMNGGRMGRERQPGQTEMEYQMPEFGIIQLLCGESYHRATCPQYIDVPIWVKKGYPVKAEGTGEKTGSYEGKRLGKF